MLSASVPAAADPGGKRLPGWAQRPSANAAATVRTRPVAPPHEATITGAVLKTAGAQHTLQLLVTGPAAEAIRPVVTFRGDPYRVVLDVGDVGIGPKALEILSSSTRSASSPMIALGLASPGRTRLVITVATPVRVLKAEMETITRGETGPLLKTERQLSASADVPAPRVLLTIALAATDHASFQALVTPDPAAKVSSNGSASALRPAAIDKRAGSRPAGLSPRRVVVIDAGHGGADPGALGTSGVHEKTIVLAVARQVRAQLDADKRFDVVMTRDSDVFVPLDRRVDLSQAAGGDVFVSLHADSIGSSRVAAAAQPPGSAGWQSVTSAGAPAASSGIRGASVYTLSNRASSEEALLLAEKENAADQAAGHTAEVADPASDIRDILIDLTRRETEALSAEFRGLVITELRRSIAVAHQPARSAAFHVLRQTRTPSVLIELGYMTNAQDQALMATPEWQRKVAASIVAAIDQFLSRQQTGALPR